MTKERIIKLVNICNEVLTKEHKKAFDKVAKENYESRKDNGYLNGVSYALGVLSTLVDAVKGEKNGF